MTENAVVADQEQSDSPLVTVSFQRNDQRKLKFLEGEPKALGITQICFILFTISCSLAFYDTDLNKYGWNIAYYITSPFVFIAGILAIAAKNLHLPLVRACLGMEILASLASFVNIIFSLIHMEAHDSCYYYEPTSQEKQHCRNVENARLHLFAELIVIHVALFAISVTLVVYACKVANCCCPATKVPVVTVQAPPAAQ